MSFESGLIHSCQILTKVQDRKLKYKSGTVLFAVGEIVTSYQTDSSGNAVLDSSGNMIPDASGNIKAISGTAATGYLQLNSISGTFKNGQILQGSLAGRAKADGVDVLFLDSGGHPAYTEIPTPSKCRFKRQKVTTSGVTADGSHFLILPQVILPASVNVTKDNRISTTERGWAGTYTIDDFYPIFGSSDIHHFTYNLTRVIT